MVVAREGGVNTNAEIPSPLSTNQDEAHDKQEEIGLKLQCWGLCIFETSFV